jgi:putative flavoprotein involved in K+ transport
MGGVRRGILLRIGVRIGVVPVAGRGWWDVIVVGGGRAGLAIEWHLTRLGLRLVVMDASGRTGDSWRSRWDWLTLFPPAQYDALPGTAAQAPADTYPGQKRRGGRPVPGAVREGGDRDVRSRRGRSTTQLGLPRYARLPDGPTLVVGGGDSGQQVAEQISAVRDVRASIGGRPMMLPQQLPGGDLFPWLTRLGVMRGILAPRLGRRLRSRGGFVIGVTRRRLAPACPLRRTPTPAVPPRRHGGAGRA